jgi:squalene-hopene/tetraprenyl-beta-curcumene cyclase
MKLLQAIPAFAIGLFAALWVATPANAQEKKKGGAGGLNWATLADKAAVYLKSSQADDGSWSKAASPGITGLVLTALLRSGKVTSAEPVAVKGLKVVEAQVDSKEGHIAAGQKVFHQNYITSVNLIALKSAAQEQKYGSIIAAAASYLKKLQWNETQGKKPQDVFYGGVGYGPGTRPDMSNTYFFLDALSAAGTPSDDPAFKKAVFFISRCQNLQSEINMLPWAGKINDGSFIYVLGDEKTAAKDDKTKPGYGSMTFAGLKGLVLCGVPKDDARVKKAREWISNNYSVDMNPGQQPGSGMRGYYYYLMTMAKCLDLLGADEIADAKGVRHNWRMEIISALANRQQKNGGWTNETSGFMEANFDLSTAYALIALSYCAPKGK